MARYEFVEGSSSKFWEITLSGSSFTTTYGKIGTAGQSTTKDWPDAATAKKEHDKLVAEKTKKGYVLAGGAATAAPAAPAKPAAAPAPAKKAAKKAAPPADEGEGDEDEAPAPKRAPAAKAAAAPAPAAPAASGGAQRYELVEGTSSKFWEITLAGSSFTTTYGKIGTAGQSTTKDWPDAATARKEHDKLVAEKTKKGYLLVGGAKASAPEAADEGDEDDGDEDEAPAPAKAKAKAAPAPAASAPSAPSAPSSGAQRYELVEGSSSKFWEIKLEGTSFTTTYGKIGTAGQSATKSFADAATAKKEHDKLVAEKTKKGYSAVGGGGGGGGGGAPAGGGGGGGGAVHTKAGTAFRLADLEQLHENPDKAETFMGLKIVDFDEEEGVKDAARRAWRINDEEGYDSDGAEWRTKFEAFLEQPGAAKVKAFVVGQWGQAMDPNDANARALVETLVKAKDKLPELAALFLCDIASEEAEISWQHVSDVAPLLKAYPNLQHLRVRGSPGGGKLGHLQHDRLRSLQIEGSNVTQDVFEQVGEADLPALEHLELWLGPEEYAGQKDVACLTPILSGKLFPALRYLGLRDSDIADQVAAAVAQAPIVERLRTLDLSLGNLTDRGVEALLASPAVARLERLDIRHHYASPEAIKKLRAHLAGGTLVESRSDNEYGDEDDRYVAVTE